MGLFDFFKKKPHYDPSNIRLFEMRTGFVFDYDLSSWRVQKTFDYEWQDGGQSIEFLIENGTLQKYLNVDDDDELFITLVDKIKIRHIDEDLPEYIVKNEVPPKSLKYNDIIYYLDSEAVGVFFENGEKEGNNLISWDYFDKSEKFILTIEQWGENSFEASQGVVLKEYEISNILPIEN